MLASVAIGIDGQTTGANLMKCKKWLLALLCIPKEMAQNEKSIKLIEHSTLSKYKYKEDRVRR